MKQFICSQQKDSHKEIEVVTNELTMTQLSVFLNQYQRVEPKNKKVVFSEFNYFKHTPMLPMLSPTSLSVYNPLTQMLTKIPIPFDPFYQPTVFQSRDNELFISGGVDLDSKQIQGALRKLKLVQRNNQVEVESILELPNMLIRRVAHSHVFHKNVLYSFGGRSDGNTLTRLSERLDLGLSQPAPALNQPLALACSLAAAVALPPHVLLVRQQEGALFTPLLMDIKNDHWTV